MTWKFNNLRDHVLPTTHKPKNAPLLKQTMFRPDDFMAPLHHNHPLVQNPGLARDFSKVRHTAERRKSFCPGRRKKCWNADHQILIVLRRRRPGCLFVRRIALFRVTQVRSRKKNTVTCWQPFFALSRGLVFVYLCCAAVKVELNIE